MSRFVRILVACLIAIALPAHGFAAASAFLCEEGNVGTAAADGPADFHPAHRHGHTGHSPDQKAGDAEIDSGAHQGTHNAGGGDANVDAMTHVACCVGAFLPTDSIRKLDPVPASSTGFRMEPVRFSVVTLDGLDPPPRFSA